MAPHKHGALKNGARVWEIERTNITEKYGDKDKNTRTRWGGATPWPGGPSVPGAQV